MLDLGMSITYFVCQKLASRKYRNVVFEISDGTVKVRALMRAVQTAHSDGLTEALSQPVFWRVMPAWLHLI